MADYSAGMPKGTVSARPRILVADDDADVRRTLARFLEMKGFVVSQASNGREALIFFLQDPPPAVCLIDLNMPELDGEGFIREVHQHKRKARIILLSGDVDADTSDISKREGVLAVFTKPFDFLGLVDAIEQFLGERLG